MLDWVESPSFVTELNALLQPTGAVVGDGDRWMPVGHADAAEARLETFGPAALPGLLRAANLQDWWLAHPERANTPNWDLATTCTIGGKRGLVLVEAKANVPELSGAGKPEREDASVRSKANHQQIGTAIDGARQALTEQIPGIAISRDTHYQLSNRVAFAWRVASLGVPTVLVYLGFTGDTGIRGGFADATGWTDTFRAHTAGVLPAGAVERPIHCGSAAFWTLVRSRPVLTPSPVLLA